MKRKKGIHVDNASSTAVGDAKTAHIAFTVRRVFPVELPVGTKTVKI